MASSSNAGLAHSGTAWTSSFAVIGGRGSSKRPISSGDGASHSEHGSTTTSNRGDEDPTGSVLGDGEDDDSGDDLEHGPLSTRRRCEPQDIWLNTRRLYSPRIL